MGAATSGCDRDRLRRLLDGDLDEGARAETLAHLDACEPCRLAMEGLAAGSRWWDDLRRIGGPTPGPTLSMGEGPGRDEATDDATLDFLEPTDSPGHVGRFGPYDVIELIGRGGMGIVLKAFDPALHRLVAIKVLAPVLAASGSARKRFLREARAAASVVHDHVVTIHAVAESRGLPYLVMAYVKGMSLQERIDRSGPMPPAEILRIGLQAARGLAAAHAQGLVHRDIKPSNILLENGVERVKLTDFGLARAVDDASLTRSGVVAGTPQYMAPEQARGEPVDHRADLFSLGSVLYAMAAGRSPFRADSTPAVLRRVCDDAPRPIREVNPEIPECLAEVVARLLAKSPADRFQDAAEVADRLAGLLSDLQRSPSLRIETREEVPPSKTSGRRSPGRLRPAAALLLLLGALGASEATGVTRVADYLATVLRFPAGGGTLVVEVSDPAVRVEVDGKAISIRGAGVEEIRLNPGSYHVEATRDGVPVFRELVAVDRGGKRVVKVGLEPDRRPESPAVRAPRIGRRAVIPGQGHEVHRLAFSPDGSTLAAVFEDGQLVLWDPAGPREILRRRAHSLPTYGLAFDPGGGKIITGAGDWRRGGTAGEVKLWDVEYGMRPTDLRSPTYMASINVVAFSPDGKLAAAGGLEVRIWEVETGRELLKIPGQTQALAFSPDGGTLAAAGADKVIELWDPAAGRIKGRLAAHGDQVDVVAFSPDGKTLASGGRDRALILWDMETLRPRVVLAGQSNWVLRLSFSGDGRILASGDGEEQVKLWDVATGSELAQLLPGGRPGFQVVWTPAGGLLATGKKDGTISLWDLADPGRAGETLGSARPPAADGTSGKRAPAPRLVMPTRGAECFTVAFSPDGATFAAAYADGTVILRRPDDGRILRTLEGPPQLITSVAFSPDGRTLALGTGLWTRPEADGVVEIWDVAEGRRLARHGGHKGPVYTVAFSPDGRSVASGGMDRTPRLWDAASGQALATLPNQGDWILALAYAPDGKTLAIGDGMVVRLVDPATGREKGTLAGHRGQVEAVAFSPDGRTIASGARDRNVKLWDAATLGERATLPGHAGWVTSLAFAPDGATVAAAALAGEHSKEVRLWDLASGRPRGALPGANSHSVAFSADGRSIATGDTSGVARIWDVDDLIGATAAGEVRD